MPEVSDFRFLVVAHTHWDREWYLPFEVFRLRLGEVVDGVLDALDHDPSFVSFSLDGQAIVVEDYLDARPEEEGRLRRLLTDGRLEVGPWYVLPDELLVGGESLVRNLLLGRRVCRRFGVEPSPLGYQPDSFGHPAQLPQILAGFGIATFLFSRGLGDELDEVGVLFRWQAGGAEVVAAQFLPHYGNFALVSTPREALERVEAVVERFGPLLAGTGCDTIVLANGSDHLPVQPELPEICAELEQLAGTAFRIGRFGEFSPSPDALPVYEGELVGGRLQNVLRGVNSARIYLKQADERAERRLLAAETAAGLRALRDGSAFPTAAIRLAWRDLLRNHPHDSICGCSCDEVHRDMIVRYSQLDRTLDVIEKTALGDGDALVNPLPYPRSRLVERDGRAALVELEGFEGKRVRLAEEPEAALPLEPVIDNGLLRVEALPDGTLTVTDLGDGRGFAGLHAVEDEPDVGDLYTFCSGGPARAGETVGVRVVRNGPLVWELLLETALPGLRLGTLVRLTRGLERVEFRTTVENATGDHRLRVVFPPAAGSEGEVRAASQFAVVRRPLGPPGPRPDWVEPPAATAHALGAVALGPFALLTKGLPEYEAGPDGIHLTLLRCVGTISRPGGLSSRPQAAGPDVATPDGQCLGAHVFEYALRFDAHDLSDAALVRAGQDYRTDFLTGDPFQPPIRLTGDVVFSCFKGAEDGGGLVLRLVNPAAEPTTATIGGAGARRIRLDEEADLGEIGEKLVLGPHEIVTLRLPRPERPADTAAAVGRPL
jgi:alpha-mannosidase